MLQYLDYVWAVYEEKSFTRAAERLFISQPALSATIKKEEERLNIKIFDRTTSIISLTQEGEAYIDAVKKIRAVEREFENKIMDIANLHTGSITVSGANFISSFVLSRIIEKFSSKYPGIKIKLLESNSKELEDFLLREQADILLDYAYNESLIDAELLLEEQVLLALPGTFKINNELKQKRLTAKDIINNKHLKKNCPCVDLKIFENENFLILKSGNSMNEIAGKLFDEYGIKPKISMQLDQLMTAYNMCSLGMGATFTSDILVKSVPDSKTVYYYKIDSKNAVRSLFIEYKKNKHKNKAMQKFAETAKELYSN